MMGYIASLSLLSSAFFIWTCAFWKDFWDKKKRPWQIRCAMFTNTKQLQPQNEMIFCCLAFACLLACLPQSNSTKQKNVRSKETLKKIQFSIGECADRKYRKFFYFFFFFFFWFLKTTRRKSMK